MAQDKVASELQLGIRELFRIVVPGAYGVMLLLLLAPDSVPAKLARQSTGVGLGASFFLGLLGYALRPHERWAPYFFHFERYRDELNREVARIINYPSPVAEVAEALDPPSLSQGDHGAVYKLFLEIKATDVKDRIHYFSSFYYMLVELSIISWVAAFWLTAQDSIELARAFGHSHWAWLSIVVITVGAASQVVLLCGLKALTSKRSKVWLSSSLLLAAGGLLIAFFATASVQLAEIRFGWAPNFVPIVLLFVAFAFERLGAKNWKQIILEQVELVNFKAEELREISRRWPQKW
jgi:hypothetical protein